MRELMENLPAVALRGASILPGMIVHFDISRTRSIKAIEAAMRANQEIYLITQRDISIENPSQDDLYEMGTIAYIKQVIKLPHDLIRILVEGKDKAKLLEVVQEDPNLVCAVSALDEDDLEIPPAAAQEAMSRALKEMFQVYCKENNKISQEVASKIIELNETKNLIEQIGVNIPLEYQKRQILLDAVTLEEQYETLLAFLMNEIEVIRMVRDVQKKVKRRVDKNQKEYILREQLKVIREELGESSEKEDADAFMEQLKTLDAPENVKKKIKKEIERFRSINSNAAESPVLRTYLETMFELPWNKKSQDSEDLTEAFRILEEDHYGLDEVKEHIMEYLAVRTLTGKGKSPILCLVGPPGTGKTSIAKSVARALNKQYVRICLGGVRDEAEIRGHRKTYVGAMPGRITAGLQQAGVSNPLMLLDEIDKTSSDYKGDTSAALLEVLDPEQNSRFSDHYVEVPQDLSEVLFIATANDAGSIPRPLLDRMDVLEISGYTMQEKEHIAKEHLIGKQIQENGLTEDQLKIRPAALKKIITGYTKEAGVRNLERRIGRICRKTAREILKGKKKSVVITPNNLADYLGKERYSYLMVNEKDEVGIARGLAWTQVGGDTLQIEVNIVPGKGELVLTGQLGDVMKESARAGISYIRSVAEQYGIAQEYFKEHEIHIHIPEGAVPKDGPSAGITMATAMFSAITGRAVKAEVAMTGEITLRGRILPIGGLKEKLLAAKYAGIKTVLVPAKNKPDVDEMSSEIKSGLNIFFVENMNEVLEKALAE